MIEYKKGDLFELLPKNDVTKIICHIVNDEGGFGSGFAGVVARRFPEVKNAYKNWYRGGSYKDIPFELGQFQIVPVPATPYEFPIFASGSILFVNMIAQHKTIRSAPGTRPIRYASLAKCMTGIANWMAGTTWEIHSPFFGSGLAQGNPDFIRELIEECWASKGIPVTIYAL